MDDFDIGEIGGAIGEGADQLSGLGAAGADKSTVAGFDVFDGQSGGGDFVFVFNLPVGIEVFMVCYLVHTCINSNMTL